MNVHAPALADAHLPDEQTSAFAKEAVEDLSQHPKRLSPKYFYDVAGSELFEAITRLPEYYPTRTELGILRDRGSEIAAIIPKGAALVEFGAGATTKVRLLLEKCALGAYVPVDISGDFIHAQAEALRRDFPKLAVYPIAADFTATFKLPDAIAPLPNAYNDAAGVTARFNLNVLVRINRELGGNFDVSGFTHRAIYNRERHRIEMHLISRKSQAVRLLGTSFSFRAGETIHTENSYKYSVERFAALARGSGWMVKETWTDRNRMFSVQALVAAD
jgi:uncharacterized SAM-dependent methyltransferase